MKGTDRKAVLLIIVAFSILATSFLPLYFKTLFVEATGHYNPLPPGIAVAIFVAYLFHKNLARKLALIVCALISFSSGLILAVTFFERARDGEDVWFVLSFVLAGCNDSYFNGQ